MPHDSSTAIPPSLYNETKTIASKPLTFVLPQAAISDRPLLAQSGRLIKEMADFLHRSGNTVRELGFDEIKKATAPEYMEAYISSQALSE